MVETTRYAEIIDAPFQAIAQEPSRPSSRWNLDRFDLLCIVAALLILFCITHLPFAPSKFSDVYFHEEAKQLSRIVRGIDPWSEISIARAPAPVLYYSIPYLVVSPDASEGAFWRAAVAWNAFWMVISILLIRRAGEQFAGAEAGRLAALLSLIVPFSIYYSFGISSEPPAYLFAVLFLYGWTRWRSAAPSKLINSGSILSLTGLLGIFFCRPNVLVVLGVAALCALAMRTQPSGRRLQAKFALMCVAVGVLAVFLVSSAINHLLPDTRGVELQSSNFSDVLFFGSFQFRKEPWDWRFWGKATRTGSVDYQNWSDTRNELLAQSQQTGTPLSHLQLRWVIRDVIHHPIYRIKMFVVRILALNVWIVHPTSQEHSGVGFFHRGFVYILLHLVLNSVVLTPLFASIWFLVAYRKEALEYWPLWGSWLALLLFHAFVYSEPRYMLPGQPGQILLAAGAMARVVDRKSLPASLEQA